MPNSAKRPAPRLPSLSGVRYDVAVRSAAKVAFLVCLMLPFAPALRAQGVELAPFGGYRLGGDLYEVYTGTRLYLVGAPCVGVTADIFVREGTSVTFIYSRQQARVEGTGASGAPVRYGTLFVEHWHAGATQELDGGQVRPFLSGSLGLTRFGGPQASEVRFSLAGSAGVKLMPSPHLGARLESRLYAVWLEGGIGRTICGGYGCAFDLDVVLLWQLEFTAALVVAF